MMIDVKKFPLVTIAIPVYKGYPYLIEAIESALNQTYPNIEIIVVNDGSPDNGETEKIALSYGDKIKYFSKPNGGVSTALNFAIKQMNGEWFSWLSHDDLYEPTKIEKQVAASKKRKDCVIRCATSLIDSSGKPIFRPQVNKAGNYSANEMMKEHLLHKLGLYGCSLLIHKDILKECGFFDEKLRMVQDEDYWIRIMFHQYSFISITDELVKSRVHEGQMTNVLSDRLDPELKILANKVLSYYDSAPENNLENLITFTCKQAKEGRRKLKKYVVGRIKKRTKLSIAQHIRISFYTAYGFIYSNIKKVYKKLVINKHRK